jgi:SAM-dependent methyltransferase
MSAWYDDDRFWQVWAPALFHARRMEAAAAEVEAILALAAPAPGSSVLDLCCGPGRHALEFARRGFRVTGVDRTAHYLEEARRRAEAEGLAAEWVREDMRAFVRPASFQLAVNLYSSFGYFEDPADDLRAARNLREALVGGGALVIEMMGKEVLARKFEARSWSVGDDGAIHLEERRVRGGWDRIECRWIRFEGERRHEALLTLRLYSGTELAGLLRAAGFSEVALYGGLDGSPYDVDARRLVALARVTRA